MILSTYTLTEPVLICIVIVSALIGYAIGVPKRSKKKD